MIQLVTAVLFVGYLLVYAAVADKGHYATAPWEALRAATYPSAAGASSGGGGHQSFGSRLWGRVEGALKILSPASQVFG